MKGYPVLSVFLKIAVSVFVVVLLVAFLYYRLDLGSSMEEKGGCLKIEIVGRFGGSMVTVRVDNVSVYRGFVDYNSTVVYRMDVGNGVHVVESFFRGGLQERFIYRAREGHTHRVTCIIY